MATEVLLMADVEGLGKQGEHAEVADGYARNHLFPKGLAAPITEAARRRLAKLRARQELAAKEELEQARILAERLGQMSCTIAVKVGEEDKMYGSVTPADVAEALEAQGVTVDRHKIGLEAPIKELGVFTVPVRLHPEVGATVKLWVVEE